MKKFLSCFLSMLVCLCMIPMTAFAEESYAKGTIVRVPITLDADTIKGGICWFSYYLTTDNADIVLVEEVDGIFNNNPSPVITETNQGHYLLTLYHTGVPQSTVAVLSGDSSVDNAEAQGCIDYVDTSAEEPVIIAYAYYKMKVDGPLAITMEANGKGGAVRAGQSAGADMVLLDETADAANPVANISQAQTVTGFSASAGSNAPTYTVGSQPSGALKGVVITAMINGNLVTFDLDEYDYPDTYQYVFSDWPSDATESTKVTITITFMGMEIPYEVEVQAYVAGDVSGNGIVNIQDALLIARAVRNGTLDQYDPVGDYNGNGSVNIQDALLIARDVRNGVL